MTQSSLTQFANQAYRGAAVSVPPLRAVIMLLNGAITNLQKSLLAQEANKFEEGFNHLTRATSILRGLGHHLNFSRGGALADRLFKTYNSLIVACLKSFGKPDAIQRYRKLIGSATELRDAWKFVAMQTSAKSAR